MSSGILGSCFALLLFLGGPPHQDDSAFKQNVETAKNILLTGGAVAHQALDELAGKNNYSKPIEIFPASETLIKDHFKKMPDVTEVGEIATSSNTQRWSIVLADGLDAHAMALDIPHELVHIENRVRMDQFVRDHPAHMLGRRILEAQQALATGQIEAFARLRPEDAEVVLKALFWNEYKAYSREFALAQEGVPLNATLLAVKNIPQFVYSISIQRWHVNINMSLGSLVDECDRFSDMYDYLSYLTNSGGYTFEATRAAH